MTHPQFDVVATLGNTPGMTFKDLGAATLITKGTLTGVVDRLVAQGIVDRVPSDVDGRSTIVKLTRVGEQLFDTAFANHLEFMAGAFTRLTAEDFDRADHALTRLRDGFKSLRVQRVAKPATRGRTRAR